MTGSARPPDPAELARGVLDLVGRSVGLGVRTTAGIVSVTAAVIDEALSQTLNAVIDRVDLDALLARVDVNALLDRVDVEALIARVDTVGIARHVIDGVDLPEIIRDSTGTMATETVGGLRLQTLHADQAVAHLVDRIMRRDDRPAWPERNGGAGAAPTEPTAP